MRLRGGSSNINGYVEVQGIEPGWGVVCDTKHGWTLKEANLVCRQLGFTRFLFTVLRVPDIENFLSFNKK